MDAPAFVRGFFARRTVLISEKMQRRDRPDQVHYLIADSRDILRKLKADGCRTERYDISIDGLSKQFAATYPAFKPPEETHAYALTA